MSEVTIRRTREPAMRQRRSASSIRDPRRRTLPTKHGHADRPEATREYQSDRSSDHDPSSIHLRPGAAILPRSPPVRAGSTVTGGCA